MQTRYFGAIVDGLRGLSIAKINDILSILIVLSKATNELLAARRAAMYDIMNEYIAVRAEVLVALRTTVPAYRAYTLS
jgi:hypothetical protein